MNEVTQATREQLGPTVLVSEVFGPTLQGEGPHAGQRVGFIRLGGCNLTCSWCDTPYTWDASRFNLRDELGRAPIAEVAATVKRMDVPRVVLSGGEPLLQDRQSYGLLCLLRMLNEQGVKIDVETNGTLVPSEDIIDTVDLFVVSPKLIHAGMLPAHTIRAEPLAVFARLAEAGRAVLKFVCKQPEDAHAACAVSDKHGFARNDVWIMPEGVTPISVAARARPLAEEAVLLGMNFTTRLHITLWGQERGR